MESHEQLDSLLELAVQLGITIRRLPGLTAGSEYPGGALTRLKGKEVLFLDSTSAVTDQLAVAAAALASKNQLNDRFIPPQLRQLIEEYAARTRGPQ